MSNELQIFTNNEFGSVRTFSVNGEPYFVGKDVTNILGYANPSKALIDHVDEEDKLNNESLSSLGQRGGWLINESGLYSLIMSSKLPMAKRFKHWITSEVLPSIRKHGAYMTNEIIEKAITSPDFLIQLATELKTEKEARKEAEQKIEEQKPLVNFASKVSESTNCISMDQMAKLLHDEKIKIGRNRLFEWLRNNKILMGNNIPYQKYVEDGLFKVNEYTYNTVYGNKVQLITRVTGKGQIYITEKLRAEQTEGKALA